MRNSLDPRLRGDDLRSGDNFSLFSSIDTYVQKHNLLPKDAKILLGLSGGPDSVFLFYYLLEKQNNKKITLLTAHLDHEWRVNSDKDAQFCLHLAKKHNITHIEEKLSGITPKKKYNGSQEEYAREARRTFFQSIAKEYNCNFIALAHHADDQYETFFIRLVRGSSLSGLCAMQPKKDTYIRPLLSIQKTEIITYLEQNNISYVTDETNISDDFLRNRIRNYVTPALKKCDDRFEHNFLRTIDKLQEAQHYLEEHTQKVFTSLVIKTNPITINLKKFFSLDHFIQQQILLLWLIKENVHFVPTEHFFAEVIKFLQSKRGGNHIFYNQWMIIKKQQTCIIQKNLD